MKEPNQNADTVDRRTVLKNSAIAVGGITAASGTASAGKGKGSKKKSAQAGWALARKKTCKKLARKKPKSFKVIGKRGTRKFPAGCSENSAKKTYVCYLVKFKPKKGKKFTARIYRRKNQKQFKKNTRYSVKHVKRCGTRCRVHFKRKRK